MSIQDLGILYFGQSNSKLQGQPVVTFSLPAGYTCPGAKSCKARFDRDLRKIIDGPQQLYRCFAASTEAARTSVRVSVDRNLALLRKAKTVERMAGAIDLSLPPSYFTRIRVHVDGDYFSLDYMMAWIEVARRHPDRIFYGYTTSLHFWVKLRNLMPPNLVLKASRGGNFDHLVDQHELPWSKVVFHPEEAEELGLEIDHDDSHAFDPTVKKFALLIHGMGPAGSKHSAAIKRLKSEGVKYSYSRAR